MNCNVFPLFRGASRQRLKHQIDQQSTDREDGRTSSYFSKEQSDAIRPSTTRLYKKKTKQHRKRNPNTRENKTVIQPEPLANIPNCLKRNPPLIIETKGDHSCDSQNAPM